MLVDFSQPILEINGDPIIMPNASSPLDLRTVSIMALLEDIPLRPGQPETVTAQQKFENALLASRLHDASEPIELKAEQIALLKDRIGRRFPALVVMRAWKILDPDGV